ncbi:unnamed protein product [Bursaphelenchus okinawaensis]|uniref:Uncharacterized protein n=1 Tax=Bursaphelenchus okinawaensis TaxID=465554 RepID=A0A811KH99_9BILA|nr:unnamed protein product [Bursaphelenchus okinawaensis]CAG9102330.1 unnamed protein product [Bursaphelenchus okinawaensis]
MSDSETLRSLKPFEREPDSLPSSEVTYDSLKEFEMNSENFKFDQSVKDSLRILRKSQKSKAATVRSDQFSEVATDDFYRALDVLDMNSIGLERTSPMSYDQYKSYEQMRKMTNAKYKPILSMSDTYSTSYSEDVSADDHMIARYHHTPTVMMTASFGLFGLMSVCLLGPKLASLATIGLALYILEWLKLYGDRYDTQKFYPDIPNILKGTTEFQLFDEIIYDDTMPNERSYQQSWTSTVSDGKRSEEFLSSVESALKSSKNL